MRPLNDGDIADHPTVAPCPNRVVGDLRRVNFIWKNGFPFENHQPVDLTLRHGITAALKAFEQSE
jgi:hypothetical protein